MKLLILVLCLCIAVAENSKLIDKLEKLYSSDSASDSQPPDIGILEKVDELDALMQDTKEPEPIASEKRRVTKKGYCFDGKTLADGPGNRGCAGKLCYDAMPAYCDREFENLNEKERTDLCKKYKEHYEQRCPFTCGFCKHRSPGLDCRRKYGVNECCWNGVRSLKPDKSDCMPCADIYPETCKEFFTNRNGLRCGSNSYHIRDFLDKSCPKLCGRCQ
ncbi:uncharacterized protein LOC116287297 [Actinia tenebrosa]|uniref:Uncharacterized protein LOC116287297 n=1 Tax=Actinia tenebrosa TaxID=6105 RepID=A0A6P8H2J9_ACTTE|nr:uncharacterized protein LOC116287297 [Actinia tenebrosa]